MKRLFSTVVACVALSLVVVPGPAQAATITPTVVLGGSTDQVLPTANATYLGWTSNSTAHPNHYNTYYASLGSLGTPTQVNPGGTIGYGVAFNGDTTEAIYQEVTAGSRVYHSNIYLYDTGTQIKSSPPSGVNSKDWEWQPTISPGFILFGRNKFDKPSSPWKVVLYDRTNTSFTTLGHEPFSCRCIFPGTVTDSFATWTDCITGTCQTYYYDITNKVAHKVPNPNKNQQYYPSVDASGTELYFVRSGNGCGAHVKIMRFDIGTTNPPAIVSTLPLSYDVSGRTFTYTDSTPHDNVYFDRYRCSKTPQADIYVVGSAETAIAVSPGGAPVHGGPSTARVAGPDAGVR